MRNINKVLIGLAIGGAAFATVGAGAGADFVDTPTAHQTINSGTMLIRLSADGHTSTSDAVTPASITLNPIGPTASTFSITKDIKAKNVGTVPGTLNDLKLSDSGPDTNPLANDVWVVVYGPDYAQQLCSNTLANCEGVNLAANYAGGITLAPGHSAEFHVVYYAGNYEPALTNVDEGKVLNTTLTYTFSG
jgi:hypothetical protein